MNKDKLQEIISRLNRFRTLNDSDVEETVLWLNMAWLVAEGEESSNHSRAKDTPNEEFRLCSLADLRNKIGITQEALAQRMHERGRGSVHQGEVLKIERGYNSPTVSRLKDYVEALGYTLNIIATKDDGSYSLDVQALTRSRTKDARKKDKGE